MRKYTNRLRVVVRMWMINHICYSEVQRVTCNQSVLCNHITILQDFYQSVLRSSASSSEVHLEASITWHPDTTPLHYSSGWFHSAYFSPCILPPNNSAEDWEYSKQSHLIVRRLGACWSGWSFPKKATHAIPFCTICTVLAVCYTKQKSAMYVHLLHLAIIRHSYHQT